MGLYTFGGCRFSTAAGVGAGGGGGGGGGGVAVSHHDFSGLLLELPRRLNEKYDPARCSSRLLGLTGPDDIEPVLGVRGVPMPGM
jgi:hypothetical protein